MDLKELLPIAVSLGGAFVVLFLFRWVFKMALTAFRVVLFLAVAGAIYVFFFAPEAKPARLLSSPSVESRHHSGH